MKLVHSLILVGLSLLALNCEKATAPKYGLPITLGSTSDEVRKVLGGPTERYKAPEKSDGVVVANPDKNDKLFEWYYSSGIVGVFDRDRLTTITLPSYTDYQGFVVYTGTVISSVTLSDRKEAFLKNLANQRRLKVRSLRTELIPICLSYGPRRADTIGASRTIL
jgi:hypothetical protein